MPQPKRKAAPVEDAATPELIEAEPKPVSITGFRPPARWVRKTVGDWFETPEGSEPMWIEVNVGGLTNRDIKWLFTGNGITWTDVWEFLAPRIRAWNVLAYDHESKAMVPAPPPAEVGVEAFDIVGVDVSDLCRLLVVSAVRTGGDELPKKSSEPASSPET